MRYFALVPTCVTHCLCTMPCSSYTVSLCYVRGPCCTHMVRSVPPRMGALSTSHLRSALHLSALPCLLYYTCLLHHSCLPRCVLRCARASGFALLFYAAVPRRCCSCALCCCHVYSRHRPLHCHVRAATSPHSAWLRCCPTFSVSVTQRRLHRRLYSDPGCTRSPSLTDRRLEFVRLRHMTILR